MHDFDPAAVSAAILAATIRNAFHACNDVGSDSVEWRRSVVDSGPTGLAISSRLQVRGADSRPIETAVAPGESEHGLSARVAAAEAEVVHGIFRDWLVRLDDPETWRGVAELVPLMSPRVRAYADALLCTGRSDAGRESRLYAALYKAWEAGQRLRADGGAGPFLETRRRSEEDAWISAGWEWRIGGEPPARIGGSGAEA